MSQYRQRRRGGQPNRRVSIAAILVLSALLVAATSGCSAIVTPSGQIETQTREVGSFDKVALSGSGTLTIVPGQAVSLTVRADKNFMKYIKTTVDNGELNIGMDAGARIVELGSSNIEFELTAPSVTTIINSGSGKITGGPFSGGAFTITDSGSGSIDLKDVNVISLSATVSGSGVVSIQGGVTGAQEVNVSGSGSFSAPGLESRVATVRVSGSGDIEIWVTEGLDAGVSGSGAISYWGTPQVTQDVTGSGEVKPLGSKSSTVGG
jgi:hypothetical protein